MKAAWGIGVALVLVVLGCWIWPLATGSPPGGSPDACLSRLAKLSNALQLYSADYNDRFPPAETWQEAIDRYAGTNEALRCPGAPNFGYGFSRALGAKEMKKVVSPSTSTVIFDSKVLAKNAIGDMADLPSPPRHGRYNAVLYVDGHSGAVDGAGKPARPNK
ncbi:hypothetical protein [Fimbriimonas ginsengisoli]|uniref:hypothetical protein n=1 Tax=Fimbriimonas ginsengisoli TaxID=1005039 RepID=UPI00056E556D|nr:hypothetical protein [Fimbriimonas ginsengisoli]